MSVCAEQELENPYMAKLVEKAMFNLYSIKRLCFHKYFVKLFSFYSLSLKYINCCPTNIYMKNPVYWRHRISGPMQIVAPVLFSAGVAKEANSIFFCTSPFLFLPPSGFLEIYIFLIFQTQPAFFWLIRCTLKSLRYKIY